MWEGISLCYEFFLEVGTDLVLIHCRKKLVEIFKSITVVRFYKSHIELKQDYGQWFWASGWSVNSVGENTSWKWFNSMSKVNWTYFNVDYLDAPY